MAKSLRSKWKRKMRAIKRVGMDEKVLIRMKKMLAAHAVEVKEQEQEAKKLAAEKLENDKIAPSEIVLEQGELTEANEIETTMEKENTETTMDVEGPAPKKGKVSLRKMKNEKNEYPVWMSNKKIKKHVKLMKKKEKRSSKTVKKNKSWKLANSL